MKYEDDYIYSRDIDWFCVINGLFVHVASAGGMLPDAVNDRDKLREIQRTVFFAPNLYSEKQINLNKQFLDERFGNDEKEKKEYLESFMAMSRKGFISVDRTHIADKSSNIYHIVCMPPNDGNLPKIENLCHYLCNDANMLNAPKGNIALFDTIVSE